MKNRIILTLLLSFGLLNSLTSCSSMPEKAQPVDQFDVNRYLGTWYEIARFDYRFEKDLDNAIAQYSLTEDGNVNVVNSGYNFKKDKWVSANGTAKFRGEKNVAALKVSFFGPFYAGYNVVALEEYKYALIAGKNLDYLWILSREKTIPENIKQKFISKAQEIGYDTSKLIWVKQDKKSPFDK
ncbi:lipocalin family protein [Chryseobacterium sp. AG844]|uniref:lipocalin family protein n=1 Tax=Chryseobacterium sp. AG844 TaxID=2183998 RepID=UPI000D71AC2E|nr:lipocalin family protein [Chryseobacterium sp. AG844]PWW26723.1 apolipoprotein D and lipocalin family protein [Chryseobacterium sp. AG844]